MTISTFHKALKRRMLLKQLEEMGITRSNTGVSIQQLSDGELAILIVLARIRKGV